MRRRRGSRPCIRDLALALAVLLLCQDLLPLPLRAEGDTLALLGFSGPPGSRAAILWMEGVRAANGDPRLVLQDPEVTESRMAGWRRETEGLASARTAGALALRGEIERLRAEAWDGYYRMVYDPALDALERAVRAMPGLDDASLAADLLFEMRLLEGMCRLALGDGKAEGSFLAAARIRPQASLPPDRYAPGIIREYGKAVEKARSGPRAALEVAGNPAGAEVRLDGIRLGAAPGAFQDLPPGTHFLEAEVAGCPVFRSMVLLPDWGTAKIEYRIEIEGPTGNPAGFFIARAAAGDTEALRRLVARAGVTRVLAGEDGGDSLRTWLFDASGRSRSISAGSSDQIQDLFAGLRSAGDQGPAGARMDMPSLKIPEAKAEPATPGPGLPRWVWIVGGVVLAGLVAGLAAGGDGSSDSRVSVTW